MQLSVVDYIFNHLLKNREQVFRTSPFFVLKRKSNILITLHTTHFKITFNPKADNNEYSFIFHSVENIFNFKKRQFCS